VAYGGCRRHGAHPTDADSSGRFLPLTCPLRARATNRPTAGAAEDRRYTPQAVDLRGQLRILRARGRAIAACFALAVAIALVATAVLPRSWESDSKLIVGNSIGSNTPDYNAQLLAQQLAQTYAEIATTDPVLSTVIDRLHLPLTVEQLRSHVSVDVPRSLNIVDVTATYSDASTAAAIANSIADQLVAKSASVGAGNPSIQSFVDAQLQATQSLIEQTRSDIATLQAVKDRTPAQESQLSALQDRLATLNTSYTSLLAYASGARANQLTVVQPASVPTDPSSPRPVLDVAVAGIAGLLVGIALAFLLDHLDDSVRSPEQVRDLLALPTLVSIGRAPRGSANRDPVYSLVTVVYPRSSSAEAFRMLRTSLEFTAVDEELRTLAVVSPGKGDGKTTVAANLAVVFAQAGRRTILVDADLHQPSAHRLLSLRNDIGLSSVVSGSATLTDALQATVEPLLGFLASGPVPPNPSELLASRRMQSVLADLGGAADLVVIDTPPIGAVTDAAILASEVGTTLVVVDATRTSRAAARQAVETLRRVGARLVGVALNRVGESSLVPYDYYEEGDEGKAARRRSTPLAPAGPAAPQSDAFGPRNAQSRQTIREP